jgi:hypothetical protein
VSLNWTFPLVVAIRPNTVFASRCVQTNVDKKYSFYNMIKMMQVLGDRQKQTIKNKK